MKTIKKLSLFVLLFFLPGFFIFQITLKNKIFCPLLINLAKADEQTVVINEIAWMGTKSSSNDEWLELKNLTNADINLDGWSLKAQDGVPEIFLNGLIAAQGYYLLERTDDKSAPDAKADLIYSGALNNSGEALELRDNKNNLIDVVNSSQGWLAGDNNTKQTMARTDNGGWQTSKNVGGTPKSKNLFSSNPSPSCGNGQVDNGEECDDGNNSNGDGCDSKCKLEVPPPYNDENENKTPEAQNLNANLSNLGDVVINEFVSDPSDGDVEWVELYNNTNKKINLFGWYLKEGSGSKTKLEGSIDSIGKNKFFIIINPKGYLNNKGDIISLYNAEDKLIDQVAYGAWNDNDNNAPAASDPYSTARKFDGHNTYNNKNDFSTTANPTKAASNIITESDAETDKNFSKQYYYSDNIIISEIFPNPSGKDTEDEFIELYNSGDKALNLKGWALQDNSQKKFIIKKDKTIKAKDYLIIKRDESKIALNNNSDSLRLYQPLGDKWIQEIKYSAAPEGLSYANKNYNKNDFVWTKIITPGEKNIIKTINHPPLVDFSCPQEEKIYVPIFFDSSDTIDEDGDKLSFNWDFGDGFTSKLSSPEHTFIKEGAYNIRLVVNDGENQVQKEKIIKILKPPAKTSKNINQNKDSLNSQTPNCKKEACHNIIINEILPNPEGIDSESEFIELKNIGAEKLNLLNWRLDDSEGGSKPYLINADAWIGPKKFLLITREESSLALNNSFDAVRLFSNTGELIDWIKYEKAPQGKSYSRIENNKWAWTTAITPGMKNIISTNNKNDKNQTARGNKAIKKQIIKTYIETSLETIKNFEPGDLIKVKGIVAVEPGILGSQYFYITGSPGIQIYNYKKDFPNLKIGDYIEVAGEISIIYGEKRIKTKSQKDIIRLAHKEKPKSVEYSCDKINQDALGQLVTISGEIVEQKGSIIWVDDGTDEASVYIKKNTGINPKEYQAGSSAQITGIISRTQSGVKIMPRDKSDIVIKDIESQKNSLILGKIEVNNEWQIAQRDKKIKLFKYLLIISGGTIILLAGILYKKIKRSV